MNYVLFFIFSCFSIQFGFSQNLALENSVKLNADTFIGFDGYENLYFIKNKVLYKHGKEGEFRFNTLNLGQISSVDIINPLKIAMFFQETNTAVLLDNKLNEIERINFNKIHPVLNAASATTASNNSLWIFNSDTQQLELFNYKSKTRTTVSQPFTGTAISQASNFNYCFILTSKRLRAFNIYGSFLNQIEIDDFERVREDKENVLLLKENTLYYISDFAKRKMNKNTELLPLESFETTIRDFQLVNDFVYIYDGKELHTFKLITPNKN